MYDYSKDVRRVLKVQPDNYVLVFSRTERNERVCKKLLAEGHNVAVVFDKVVPGETYLGYPVVDGDVDDLRFLDRTPCIVGLKAKGRATKDTTGFVVRHKDDK